MKALKDTEDVNRKWAVQAKEVQGVMSSHYELGNVIRDIEDVLDDSKYGRLEFPGTSKPEAENAEKVKDSLEGAAKSLVTTVAGGTIGGIFNSLAAGIGWARPAGDHHRVGLAVGEGQLRGAAAQEEAQAERIKMWEDESDKRASTQQRTCGRKRSGWQPTP